MDTAVQRAGRWYCARCLNDGRSLPEEAEAVILRRRLLSLMLGDERAGPGLRPGDGA